MQNNEITIIINTFNSEDKIFSCLNSIGSDYKIIIIDLKFLKNKFIIREILI